MKRLAILLAVIFAVGWVAGPRPAHATACTAGCVKYIHGTASSGTTVSATVPTVTAGHSLRIWFCYPLSNTVSSLTNTVSAVQSGTTAVLGTHLASSGSESCNVGFVANATAGSNVATLTVSTSCTGGCDIWSEEWPDPTTGTMDGQNATYSTIGGTAGQTVPCGNITTTGSNDTIEAFLYQGQSVAPTYPSGYSSAYIYSTWIYLEYSTGNAANTYNPSFLSGTNAYNNYVVCAGFTQAANVGPPAGSRGMLGVGQ